MSGFVEQCKQVGMNPSTTGIIRSAGQVLKLEYGCMTDVRAEAIVHTLRASSSGVQEAYLRSNGLTEKGAKSLLSALPESVQLIDLSQNDLGHNAGWCSSLRRLTYLRKLVISDSQLGDTISRDLCMALINSRHLKHLNLSGNGIFKAAAKLGELVREHEALEELDVHWNHITGESARDLLQGLYENGRGGGSLRDLNFSWNPLGKAGGEEACRKLAQVFVENDVLRHLDFSKCELSAGLCQILADGLRDNSTILGLHISGNEGRMNTRGYIVPMPPSDIAQRSAAAAAAAASTEQPGGPQADTEQSQKSDQTVEKNGRGRIMSVMQTGLCCWVCESWRETRILYVPGISGPEAADVWIFTSVDDYEQAIKLTKVNDGLATYIMCPPGTLHFIFQVGNEVMPSRTAPHIHDAGPVTITRVRTAADPAPGEEDPDVEGRFPLKVEVACLNAATVVAREADEPVCVCSAPRSTVINEPKFSKEPIWKVKSSLFAPYDEALERRAFCEKCFDVDWRTSRIPMLIDDDQDRLQVKDILRAHYAEIKVLFGSLCTAEWAVASQRGSRTRRLTFGVSLNEFTHMLVQHNLLGEELTMDDADSQFLIAAMPARDTSAWDASTHKEGHLVLRHGFFELLVCLALCRFNRGLLMPDAVRSKHKAKAKSASQALDLLLNKHIMYPYPPMKHNFNCVQWRVDVLHTQVVESIFRKHMKAVIDPLFIGYSSVTNGRRCLTVEGWFELLDALEVLPCSDEIGVQNTWDRAWVWEISSMSHIDELMSSKHLELTFAEFLEALARLVGLLQARKMKEARCTRCGTIFPPEKRNCSKCGAPRQYVEVPQQESEKYDYGLGWVSPSYTFCMAKEEVMDKDNFAKILDAFIGGAKMKAAVADAANRTRPDLQG